MVRLLIRMRAAMIAHQRSSKFGTISLIFAAVIGLLTALSTMSLGFVHYPRPTAGTNVVVVVMAVWVIACVAYAAFTGGGSTLRLEIFRLLPIPLGVFGRALLIIGLFDPVLLFTAVAFAGLVALGAQGGLGPAMTAVAGVLLTLALTSVLVSMVEAAMPPGSRRRQDAGTMLVAIVISLVAIAGSLLPTLIAALTAGTIPVLSAVVRILPSGWAAAAVEGAASGNPVLTALPLAGLVSLVVVLVCLWPVLLTRRLDGTVGAARRTHSRRVRAPFLPQTPIGAVIAIEVRMWAREPLRLTFLIIAAIVGLGVCVIPEVTHGPSLLLPFAGVITVVIAGAGGCNLYGSDGLALRLTVTTPGSERADVRGRQLAWLLLVGPYALCLTVILTLISGQTWAWPLGARHSRRPDRRCRRSVPADVPDRRSPSRREWRPRTSVAGESVGIADPDRAKRHADSCAASHRYGRGLATAAMAGRWPRHPHRHSLCTLAWTCRTETTHHRAVRPFHSTRHVVEPSLGKVHD